MRHSIRILLLMIFVAAFGGELAAHVTVQPKEVPVKSFQEFLVRVPTEKDLPTTAVRLVFPEGFELLRIRPTAGWKYELERDANGRISTVTWSGGSIGRAEYEVFSFMARSQAEGTVTIEAYQTYGKDDVVAWVNPAEPRPAPQIKVLPAGSGAAEAATTDHAAPAAVPGTAGNSVMNGGSAATSASTWISAIALLAAMTALFISWQASRRLQH
jgi:YD repeat-containing protein